MKIKIVFAVFGLVALGAAFPCLPLRGQAQPLRHPAAALPAQSEYGLVYLWLPDTSHPKRSHWRWVLQKSGHPPYPPHGTGRLPHAEVEAETLADPSLKAYIGRIPAGKSIELLWQFKSSALAHQAGLASLQQLCARRNIGFHIFSFANTA